MPRQLLSGSQSHYTKLMQLQLRAALSTQSPVISAAHVLLRPLHTCCSQMVTD